MMQYVQKNEQPSWTLTNARVRSTDARRSAMPSISTPDSVGSARGKGTPPSAAGPTNRCSSSSSASFDRLSTRRAVGSAAANASCPTWTEQPVTTSSAAGFDRRARRTAWRDFWSAVAVTVQVLTSTRSAPATSPSTTRIPRSRSSRAADSISDWLTLQPRFVIAAVRTGRGTGALELTTATASCS
jgi:hypothetical protein